jgi:hypothetical protein
MLSNLLSGASSVLGGLSGGGAEGPSYAASTATAGQGDFKPDTLSSVIPLLVIFAVVALVVKYGK